MLDFSSSPSSLRPTMWGFRPRSKLAVQMQALMMVRMMRLMVMTAKAVRGFRTGRKVGALDEWYMRTSLKRKYARPAK